MMVRARSLGVVIAALALLAPSAARAGSKPLQIRYEGTLDLEAHFHRPGETRPYHSEARWYWDGKGGCRLDWMLWEEGDTSRVPESYLVTGARVFYRPVPGSRWRLSGGARAPLELLEAEAGVPAALLRDAGAHLGPGHPSLVIRHGRLEELVLLRAHPRLGDVRDSVIYTFDGKEAVPSEMLLVLHERDQQWRLRQHRVEWKETTAADSLFQAPDSFDPPRVTEEDETMTAEPRIVELAPHVFAAEMDDIDSRSLIVEFRDHLAMIELAIGSANGERLADAARKRWPGKPIRYALFSHYHPSYAGGLRAMIAEGATVITPVGNEAFVRGIADLPFTVEPDRLAKSPKPLAIRAFTDSLELKDSMNRLVAYNYGARSNHADDFVVFSLPQARMLFETELGWVTVNGKLRASRRAAPLLKWIDEKHLDVDGIVQSWPMRGEPGTMPRSELQALAGPPKQ
jgi:hypothetical protein